MNRAQKGAWLIVIAIGSAVLLSAVSTGVIYYLRGFPAAKAGLAFMGLAGICGIAPFIFRKDPGAVTCDERDRAINSTAARAGFAVSYLVFGGLCMGLWWYFRAEGKIDVDVLPWIWTVAFLTFFFVYSLMILILYGREKTDE